MKSCSRCRISAALPGEAPTSDGCFRNHEGYQISDLQAAAVSAGSIRPRSDQLCPQPTVYDGPAASPRANTGCSTRQQELALSHPSGRPTDAPNGGEMRGRRGVHPEWMVRTDAFLSRFSLNSADDERRARTPFRDVSGRSSLWDWAPHRDGQVSGPPKPVVQRRTILLASGVGIGRPSPTDH